MELSYSAVEDERGFFQSLKIADFLYAFVILLSAGVAVRQYGAAMDGYEHAILAGTALGLVALGWFWKSWQWFFPLAGGVALLGIASYQGDIARGQTAFFLRYVLSSQSAIMWMCTFFFLATGVYWLSLWRRSAFLAQIGSGLTWAAAVMGLAGLFVRWEESYLLGADVGHIPVSNLYEVFVLFSLITALMYLYYENRFRNRQMGAFVLLVISAAVGFLLWYAFSRQAHEIQPLIPALQSWWMKIHVPANFIGYGAFAMSAMLGVAQILSARGILAGRLPRSELLDEVMYRAIAVGFLFFTIATILGAMWAADAWGGYWSWDPKETWALIVWLNYAAWLHVRLVKGWRGPILAWWAVIGLFVTAFAFLGVNMFLSGLHSYGSL